MNLNINKLPVTFDLKTEFEGFSLFQALVIVHVPLTQ
jgi:hypothetical protein